MYFFNNKIETSHPPPKWSNMSEREPTLWHITWHFLHLQPFYPNDYLLEPNLLILPSHKAKTHKMLRYRCTQVQVHRCFWLYHPVSCFSSIMDGSEILTLVNGAYAPHNAISSRIRSVIPLELGANVVSMCIIAFSAYCLYAYTHTTHTETDPWGSCA